MLVDGTDAGKEAVTALLIPDLTMPGFCGINSDTHFHALN